MFKVIALQELNTRIIRSLGSVLPHMSLETKQLPCVNGNLLPNSGTSLP